MKNMIYGTAQSYVKAMQMRQKWAMKKQGLSITDISNSRFGVSAPDTEETQKTQRLNNIKTKLKAGIRLSGDELEYLRRESPELYQKVVQIEARRAAYKERLKNCKTKDDVQELQLSEAMQKSAEVNAIANNPNIPLGKKLELTEGIAMEQAAITQEHDAFVASGAYGRLKTRREIRLEEAKEEKAIEEAAEEKAEKEAREQERINSQQTKPEQTQPEQTQPEQTQPEQTQPEQTQPEQTQPEQTQPEQTQPEQTQPEQTKPEQTQPEQAQPEYKAESKPIKSERPKHPRSEIVRITGPTYTRAKVAAEVAAAETRMSPVRAQIQAAKAAISTTSQDRPSSAERTERSQNNVGIAKAKRRYLGR